MGDKVYSVFAGLGKTTLAKGNKNFIDLESSDFQWIPIETEKTKEELKGVTRELNPEFPENYIQSIQAHLSDGKNVLISSHPKVLDLLEEEKIPFVTVCPSRDSKQEIIQRYVDRGNPKSFIEMMESNFEEFISDMESRSNVLVVEKGMYLSQLVKQ